MQETLAVSPAAKEGVEKVQQALARWTEMAAKGRFGYIAIVGAEGNNQFVCEFTGVPGHEPAINYGLDIVKDKIIHSVRLQERHAQRKDASYVYYEMTKASICWDFSSWLIDAEMTRVREGAPAPLKVCFLYEPIVGAPNWSSMLNNVMRPLLPLIGAVEDMEAGNGRTKEFYALRYVTEAAKKGEAVPRFSPSDSGILTMEGYRGCVTITLRETDYFEHRNSNLVGWLKFANDLRAKGERVVFVRDTAKADEFLEGFEICPAASRIVDIRAALYDVARHNFFVSNGPFALGLFGRSPWLCFIRTYPVSTYECELPAWWTINQGVTEGEQFPWSTMNQRIVWEKDDYVNICAAWELQQTWLKAA